RLAAAPSRARARATGVPSLRPPSRASNECCAVSAALVCPQQGGPSRSRLRRAACAASSEFHPPRTDGAARRSVHFCAAPSGKRFQISLDDPGMAGILRYGSYVPYFRLQRATMGAGKGERAVASFDEDSVSMAVEAARDAVRGGVPIDAILFATTSPAYAEKLDTATIQAALDLPESVTSLALTGSPRMGLAALLVGFDLAAAGRPTLVCASDVVAGLPGGGRESQGGDGAAAFVTGPDANAIARLIGHASTTMEILDVWRLPEE